MGHSDNQPWVAASAAHPAVGSVCNPFGDRIEPRHGGIPTRFARSPSHEVSPGWGLGKEALKHAFLDNLFYMQGKFPALATARTTTGARLRGARPAVQRWISTASAYTAQGSRTVAYLSAEFLMGPHLGNNLVNLGIYDEVQQAMAELGLDLDELLQRGGGAGPGQRRPRAAGRVLSRLAGHARNPGARLRHPLRVRHFRPGDRRRLAGRERTDKWLRFGNPWEIARPEWAVEVKLGGHTERYTDEHGR